MGSLRAERDEVPEHVRILQVRLGVPLLGVDEAGFGSYTEERGTLDERITQEERQQGGNENTHPSGGQQPSTKMTRAKQSNPSRTTAGEGQVPVSGVPVTIHANILQECALVLNTAVTRGCEQEKVCSRSHTLWYRLPEV